MYNSIILFKKKEEHLSEYIMSLSYLDLFSFFVWTTLCATQDKMSETGQSLFFAILHKKIFNGSINHIDKLFEFIEERYKNTNLLDNNKNLKKIIALPEASAEFKRTDAVLGRKK